MSTGPSRNDGIDLRLVAYAPGIVREPCILSKLRLPNGAHQPLKKRIPIDDDDDVLAVRAYIGVRRHDTGDRRAGRPSHYASAVEFRHHAFQDVEYGLKNRYVYDLS